MGRIFQCHFVLRQNDQCYFFCWSSRICVPEKMVYQCVRNACGDNVVFLHYAIQSEVRNFFCIVQDSKLAENWSVLWIFIIFTYTNVDIKRLDISNLLNKFRYVCITLFLWRVYDTIIVLFLPINMSIHI